MEHGGNLSIVILAAGPGSRLGELTKEKSKALVSVQGVPLVLYAIAWARLFSPTKIIVVGGSHYDLLRDVLGEKTPDVALVENKEWATSRRMESLYSTKDEILGGLFFFDVDYIMRREGVGPIHKGFGDETTYFATSTTSPETTQDGEVVTEDGRFVKDIVTHTSVPVLNPGEFYVSALMYISEKDVATFFDAIHTASVEKASTKNVLDHFKKSGRRVMVYDLKEPYWAEVDTREELTRAEAFIESHQESFNYV